jgi:hypothetical protein
VPATTTAVQSNGATTLQGNTLSAKNGIAVQGPDVHIQRNHVTAVTGRGISVVDSASKIDASDTVVQLVGNGTGVVADTGNGTDAAIADPLFAGGMDFRLSHGSPAIDAGDPAASSEPSDFDGNARVLDGTGSGVARRDMGAFEAPAVPVVTQPGGPSTSGDSQPAAAGTPLSISGLTVSPSRFAVAGTGPKSRRSRTPHGTRFRFQLSTSADVRIVIQRRGRGHRFHKVGSLTRHAAAGLDTIRFSGRLGRKALRPGRYSAMVTATDAAGHRTGTQRVTFTIVPAAARTTR